MRTQYVRSRLFMLTKNTHIPTPQTRRRNPGIAPADQHQRDVLDDASGRSADGGAGAGRQHHRGQQHQRAPGGRAAGALHADEGGGPLHDAVPGVRAGAARDPVQRAPAGDDADPAGPGRPGGAREAGVPGGPDAPGARRRARGPGRARRVPRQRSEPVCDGGAVARRWRYIREFAIVITC